MAKATATSDPPHIASDFHDKLCLFGNEYRSLASTVNSYQDDCMTHVCATKTWVWCRTHIPDDQNQLQRAKEYLARAKAQRITSGLRLYNRVMTPGAVPQDLANDWTFLTLVAELELFVPHDQD